MKKQIMKRAWEIYRTLEGDRIAKLSMALRQAWREEKTSTVEMGWNVRKLIEAGANRWQKYGKDRIYLSDAAENILGMDIDRYKSGRICYAAINGESISNAEANRYLGCFSNAYIDMTTGKVYGICGRHADEAIDALAAYAA